MSKVLIFDDKQDIADRCRRLVEKTGHDAVLCQSGRAALDAASSHDCPDLAIFSWEAAGPPFVTDILARWKQIRPETPIIITLDQLEVTLAARLGSLGAFDTLLKPFDAPRVHEAIRRALAPAFPDLPLVEEMRKTILGESTALLKTLHEVARAIPHDEVNILLLGESGTGKELFARAIHELSSRKGKPWVPVNVAAIPLDLAESSLFGHEKGAFTSAVDSHKGYLEEAADGTVFFDEIGDLPLSLQTKLLRAIQEREFRRLKGTRNIKLRSRLVCATHQDLASAAHQRSFRLDLYNRLSQVPIHIPPLRERGADLELLADHFLRTFPNRRVARLARETKAILQSYPFPGNVRELANILSKALIHSDDDWIFPNHLPLREMGIFAGDQTSSSSDSNQLAWPSHWLSAQHGDAIKELTQDFDRTYLSRKYKEAGYKISRAAQLAGIDRKTFTKRWEECGLPRLNPLGKVDHE